MADQQDSGGTQWTNEAFEAWLSETARAEDSSREELLHRMLASFWVLSEYEDIVRGDDASTFPQGALGPSSDLPFQSDRPDVPQPGTGEPSLDELFGVVEQLSDYLDHTTQPTDSATTTGDATPAATPKESPPDTAPPGTEPETTDAAPELDPAAIAERLDAVESAFAQLEQIVQDLAGVHLELEDAHDDLAADHDSFADRVDEDFDQVEAILTRLVDRYEGHESAIDTLEKRLRDLRMDHRFRATRTDRLADVLQTAHEHGVSGGVCDSCDGTVNLGLLSMAACPHCRRRIVDVEPGGWFRSNTIVTQDPQTTPASGRHAGRSPNQPTDRTTTQPINYTPDRHASDARRPNTPGGEDADGREQAPAEDGFEWLDSDTA